MLSVGTFFIATGKDAGTKIRYKAEYEDTPTRHGIDGGRISKLELRLNGEPVAQYDNKWVLRPRRKILKSVIEILSLQPPRKRRNANEKAANLP